MNRALIYVSLVLLVFVSPIAVSEQAAFTDFNGNTQSISHYSGNGKWLVVMLWASDCTVCNREAHNYQDFYQSHLAKKDASVLGISLDGVKGKKAAQAFIDRHNIKFPNLLGDAASIVEMYQTLTGSDWVGTPSFMVYTPDGKLLGAQAGAVPVEVIESFIKREDATAEKS